MTYKLIEPLYIFGGPCCGYRCTAVLPNGKQPGELLYNKVFRSLKGARLHVRRVHHIELDPKIAFPKPQ